MSENYFANIVGRLCVTKEKREQPLFDRTDGMQQLFEQARPHVKIELMQYYMGDAHCREWLVIAHLHQHYADQLTRENQPFIPPNS